ncbi:MAG: hypothetical protein EBR82_76475 [Caulobacteraceae bacterium]|nr:hypothetical protein [Caulobacteraceae bacterium]
MIIVFDMFPAILVAVAPNSVASLDEVKVVPPTEGSFMVDKCRVVIDSDIIIVAVDSPDGAKVIFQEEYTTFEKDLKGESKIITKSGKMLAFKRDTNCGCGSRLRSWNPRRTLVTLKEKK